MPLNNPTVSTEVSTGTYTGDSSTNRAIPHNLSGTPKLVVITNNLAVANYDGFISQQAVIRFIGTTCGQYAVTIPDSTNFYVGKTDFDKSCNLNTAVYKWVAFT